jgi:hypothetical protein
MSELVPTEDNDYTEVFKEHFDQKCVEFSVGNPRVEHITGIVHLYKRNNHVYGSHEPWRSAESISEVRLGISKEDAAYVHALCCSHCTSDCICCCAASVPCWAMKQHQVVLNAPGT